MKEMNLCPSCDARLRSPDARGCSTCGWRSPLPPLVLSPDQEAALALLDSGANVFVTGPGGVGKTWVLRRWLESLEARKDPRAGNVALTGSTGVAAVLLGGRTLHSWLGCGLGKGTAQSIADDPRFGWRYRIAPRIRKARVLVVDEASMISGQFFSLASDLCRIARGPGGTLTEASRLEAERRARLPFGGLQVVLVGDMGQLEPVESETGYAFETEEWWDADVRVCELTTVHRQSDEAFVQTLREVRDGTLTEAGRAMLESRVRAFDPDADPPAVRLSTHNSLVDAINVAKLEALPGPLQVFRAVEEGDPKGLEALDKHCLSPRDLFLKVGARVMFTRNDPPGPEAAIGRWVNGTLGTVTWLSPEDDGSMEVTTDDGQVLCPDQALWQHGVDGSDICAPQKGLFRRLVKRREPMKGEAYRLQFPLKLAWALSIHKIQGSTLDRASIDLTSCFAAGQAYVALSRVRTLAGLNIEGWAGAASIMTHPAALRFLRGQYAPPQAYLDARATRVPRLLGPPSVEAPV